jgi:predicted metal-dependent phosphoesterase TrpH
MSLLTVEFHCHTYHSKDSLMLPEHILEACVRRNIDRIAITDHNAINGALEAATLDPERVIIGEEIMTTQGELLGYFMKEFIPPGLTPQETISRLRSQGAFISVAHPFDYIRQGAWKEGALLEILDLVDALEVFNARTWSSNANRRAEELAKERKLLRTAGSDAHAPLEIGRAVMNLQSFNDAESMRQSLSTATIQARRSSPLVHLFSRYATLRKALGWKHIVR